MNNKKILSGLVLASATLFVVAPTAVKAVTNGTSDATVTIKKETTPPGPSGAVTFVDVSNSAKINFAETELTGAELTAAEANKGTAKIKISDTRANLGAGKTGKYTVTVKDITPTSQANGILKNNMALKFASTNLTGTHTHKAITLNGTDQEIFNGVHETNIKDKTVTLNPTLTIPSAVKTAGTYNAKIEWTLTAGDL